MQLEILRKIKILISRKNFGEKCFQNVRERKGVERRMFPSESMHKICKVNLINGIIARVRCIFKIYHSNFKSGPKI